MQSQKRRKSLAIASLISFTLLLSDCGHIVLHDAEWCADEGVTGAECFHTFKADHRELEKSAWDTERFGMLCTKAQNFADWKTAILQLCAQTKNCTHDEIQAIKRVAEKAAAIEQKAPQ